MDEAVSVHSGADDVDGEAGLALIVVVGIAFVLTISVKLIRPIRAELEESMRPR